MPKDSDILHKVEKNIKRQEGGHNLEHKYFESIVKDIRRMTVSHIDRDIKSLFRLIRSTNVPFGAIVVSEATSTAWNKTRESMRDKNIDLDRDRVAIYSCEHILRNESYAFDTLGEAALFIDLIRELIARGVPDRMAVKISYRNSSPVAAANATKKIKESLTTAE